MRAGIERSVHSALDQHLDNQFQAISGLQAASGQVHDLLVSLQTETAELRNDVTWLRDRMADSRDDITRLLGTQHETRRIAGGLLDRVAELRERLVTVRTLPGYSAAFDEKEPLITVRIATYNRADLLLDRSLPSVLAQTYENFEIVVVGDGCTDDTAERIAGLGDPRIRFVNLPYHAVYPRDPTTQWMVAGGPAMNVGAELARGRWIALLDDDDEFFPEHLAVLLEAARAGRYEMVCSKFVTTAPYDDPVLGRYPPTLGQFSFVGGLCMAELRFFEFDARSWMLGEPHDWNLCRRMMEAGVRIGWVDQVLAKVYPSGPREDVRSV